MNRVLLIVSTLISVATYGDEVSWQSEPVHKIDIDCDGVDDSVFLRRIKNDFIINVLASSSKTESQLQFGLAQSARQDAICGKTPNFTTYNSDAEAQKMMFDEAFEGSIAGSLCFDFNISGGECDSITVFYNHKTQELNWWRL